MTVAIRSWCRHCKKMTIKSDVNALQRVCYGCGK